MELTGIRLCLWNQLVLLNIIERQGSVLSTMFTNTAGRAGRKRRQDAECVAMELVCLLPVVALIWVSGSSAHSHSGIKHEALHTSSTSMISDRLLHERWLFTATSRYVLTTSAYEWKTVVYSSQHVTKHNDERVNHEKCVNNREPFETVTWPKALAILNRILAELVLEDVLEIKLSVTIHVSDSV